MKCLICEKPADSRKLCRGHYVAAKRMKVLDRFPRLVRSSSVMQTEVQAYLAKEGDGGVHPKSPATTAPSMNSQLLEELRPATHPKSVSGAKCPHCEWRGKNLNGVLIHIGKKHQGALS